MDAHLNKQLFDEGIDGKPLVPKLSGELAKKFLVPPFSVLSAREGPWQARKNAWKNPSVFLYIYLIPDCIS